MITSFSSLDSVEEAVDQLPIREPARRLEVAVPQYFARKAFWMKLIAGCLLLGFSPLILLIMLAVRLTSSGPALFRQKRLGKDGKLFEVLKIRTMYCDAEELSGPILCQPGDSRITPLGRLLRFLHLDELPQLVNVVRGEMCLVGPRPERPEIIARHKLNEMVRGFSERTKVLPGVTGLAQINLPADQTAECVIPKVELDLEYLTTASAGLDLRILLCTAMRMLGTRHGRAVKLFGVDRNMSTLAEKTLQRGGRSIPRRYHLHILQPAKAQELAVAHVSANGVGSSSSTASNWDEFSNENLRAAGENGSEFASSPHRPR